MTVPEVRLASMSEADFQAYLQADIGHYAEEQVRAGNWAPEEARQRSEEEHRQLLPDGLRSKDQHLFSAFDAESGAKVGLIWFAINQRAGHRRAFIYDFVIDEEFRRRGYGAATLRAAEAEARALGAERIELHVFGHNRAAQALYQKADYEVAGVYMAKKL